MRVKHKKAIGPSAKPIPKIISFQDPLPEPQRYRPQADRILSGDPAQAATSLFQSTAAASNPAYGQSSPENGVSSLRKASSVLFWRVSSWSAAMTARSALSEQATFSCRPPAFSAPGKSLRRRKNSTQTMSDYSPDASRVTAAGRVARRPSGQVSPVGDFVRFVISGH